MNRLLKILIFSTSPILYINAQELSIYERANQIQNVPNQLPLEERKIFLRRGEKLEVLTHSIGHGHGIPGSNVSYFSTIYKDMVVFVIPQSEPMDLGSGNMYLYVLKQAQITNDLGIQVTLPHYTLIKKTLISDEKEFTSHVLMSVGAKCIYECRDDYLHIEVTGKKNSTKKISLND